MRRRFSQLLALLLAGTIAFGLQAQTKIDRKALVQRHTVINTKADTLASLSVGNGAFAFTVDATGLQTFTKEYEKGVPLGTQSDWGWNGFQDTVGYKREEALKTYQLNGRPVTYTVQWNAPERNRDAANWFRANPHRLQLGNLGLEIRKKDGSRAALADIKNIRQELNMWTGEIKSAFTVEGVPVRVSTYAHQRQDVIGARIQSRLIQEGRLKVSLRFPFPTAAWADYGTNYAHGNRHRSSIEKQSRQGAVLLHQIDTTKYYVAFHWTSKGTVSRKEPHLFLIAPNTKESTFELSCRFSPRQQEAPVPTYAQVLAANQSQWPQFWNRGGAIDFAGSTDPRAREIERRVILSQYLTKIQCAGAFPPQETGLTYNSWFGKPHLEMHWWHGVHFALWGRTDLLEKSLDWYFKVADIARQVAQRQGYAGVRWQKMTNNTGEEVPSTVGAFLLWQQPHYIYFAELVYRDKKNKAVLDKYKDLVFATADFMASFPTLDPKTGRYNLGKGVIPAQERFKPEETFNPTYELAYWHWALETAQQWRQRLNLPRNKKWDEVLNKLAPLPTLKGVYLAAESAPDSYTNPEFKTDHPSVLGAWGMLPLTPLVDTATMNRTFNLIWDTWTWKDTWGWDFPMTAMTATRLGRPDKAIAGLLMPIQTNTYLPNGHNYQDERLRIYLPGNGGVLAAVAMMVAGYDGSGKLPGIPQDGTWKVRWEGLKPMP